MKPEIESAIAYEVDRIHQRLTRSREPDDASSYFDTHEWRVRTTAMVTQRMYLRACEPITRAIVDLHLFALPKYELGADGLRLVDDGLTPAMRSSLNQLHEWLASVARDHGVTYIPPAPITKEHNSHENQPRPKD